MRYSTPDEHLTRSRTVRRGSGDGGGRPLNDRKRPPARVLLFARLSRGERFIGSGPTEDVPDQAAFTRLPTDELCSRAESRQGTQSDKRGSSYRSAIEGPC